ADSAYRRRRRAVARRDASGSAPLEHHQLGRGVALRHGCRVCRGGPSSRGRLRALHLSDPGRRRPLDPRRLRATAAAVRASRLRRSVSTDTPLPPEEPHGTNPPAGAVIDYLLRAVPPGSVTVEIRDARGGVVRRFSSDDRPPPPAEAPQVADEWLPRFAPPTRTVGLNRFVWDLRYAPPPAARYGYSIAAVARQGTAAEPQ